MEQSNLKQVISLGKEIFGSSTLDPIETQKNILDFSKIVPFLNNYSTKTINFQTWKSIFGSTFTPEHIFKFLEDNYDDDLLTQLTGRSDNEWNFLLNGLSKILEYEILARTLCERTMDITKQIKLFDDDKIIIFSHIISLLSKLCQKTSTPFKPVRIFANFMLPYQFFIPISEKSDTILLISSIKFNKSFFQELEGWAILTPTHQITICDKKQQFYFNGNCSNFDVKQTKVKFIPENIHSSLFPILQKEISFTCLDERSSCQWQEVSDGHQIMFLDSFRYLSISETYPPSLLLSIFNNLFSDDILILQTLVKMKYTSLNDINEVLDAIVTLSIASQRLDMFLAFITYDEISSVRDQNLILRNNSPCTHLFSVFYQRYAKEYIDNILKPLIIKITFIEADDLNDQNTNGQAVFDCVSLVADSIINNFDQIPLEIRHLATHIYNAAKCCYGTRISTFRSITSFFVLRFLIPFIATPCVSEIMEITPLQLKNILIPFGSIFHDIFSCIGIPGKYSYLKEVEDQIVSNMTKYVDFFASLPLNLDQLPKYKMPKNEQIDQTTAIIINTILNHKESFFSTYDMLSRDSERTHPFSYRMVDLLCTCFEKNKE